MSGRPSNVEEVSRQLIDAGIARRMLRDARKSNLPDDPEVCVFWVEAYVQDGQERVWIFAVSGSKTLAFWVGNGEAFGNGHSRPLDRAQMALIERLAGEYKLANASA